MCLRSSGGGLLSAPKAQLKTGGDRALAVRALKLCNELPEEIRSPESLTSFTSPLKTYFYQRDFFFFSSFTSSLNSTAQLLHCN